MNFDQKITLTKETDITTVAFDLGIDLKKSGSRLVANCPLHEERTPSFYLYPNHYHCYGCGAHGDVITLYEKVNNLSFNDTVNEMLQRYHGITDPNSENLKQWSKPVIKPKAMEPKKTGIIPKAYFLNSLKGYDNNHFVKYLYSIFEREITQDLINRYFIGSSKTWEGSTSFWYIDVDGNIRDVNIILYNSTTGRRIKKDQAPNVGRSKCMRYGNKLLQLAGIDGETKRCFFGEHLLSKQPDKTVCIVESEKTAILSSIVYPQGLWLATGGESVGNHLFNVLQGRRIRMFPDLNKYDSWCDKAKELKSLGILVEVSDLLERKATDKDWKAGYDLADYIQRDPEYGWAVPNGYPAFWDYGLPDMKIDEKPVLTEAEKLFDTIAKQHPKTQNLHDKLDCKVIGTHPVVKGSPTLKNISMEEVEKLISEVQSLTLPESFELYPAQTVHNHGKDLIESCAAALRKNPGLRTSQVYFDKLLKIKNFCNE